VPDVVLIRAGHAYGLELKADDGRPSSKQIEAMAAMETEGCMNPKAWPDDGHPKIRELAITIPSAINPIPTMTISASMVSRKGICFDCFMVLRLLAPAHGGPLGQRRK
jgi:hypothetical protein